MPKYTLVKTINADGKSPLFYFEGPSDATEPTDDWITDNSELLQKDTGVRKFKKGNTWEPIASSDGSGGGSLVVTLTPGETESSMVGDKTLLEIYDAYMSHKNVQFVLPIVGAFNAISVMKTEDAGNDIYLVLYPDMGERTIEIASGGASDYFSIDS